MGNAFGLHFPPLGHLVYRIVTKFLAEFAVLDYSRVQNRQIPVPPRTCPVCADVCMAHIGCVYSGWDGKNKCTYSGCNECDGENTMM
jgi:hypothetical protein